MKVSCVLVCAILFTGCSATTVVNREAGDEFAFTIVAMGQTIATCNLITPAEETLEFTPGVPSQFDRFELQEAISLPSCSILLKNLQNSDNGMWTISFVSTSGNTNSQSFQLAINATEQYEPATSKPENDDDFTEEIEDEIDDTEWLNTIELPTRHNKTIDISLPRIKHDEKCSVLTPKGEIMTASTIENVKFHKNSYFVSCRITVGPMIEDLLGNWTVCGKYTEDNKEYERCQSARIYWNIENNPGTAWHIDMQETFNHPVHLDSTLSPVVIGIGDVVACHIVTCEGEDLAVDEHSKYPSIKATLAHSTCSFAIGPIHADFLGYWEIYGLFTNAAEGLHEVRLPFNMYIYDKENPFNKSYNRTIIDPVIRAVRLGNTLNVEVSVNMGQVDSCSFNTPENTEYTMGNGYNFEGASFVKVGGNVVCRVAIGPITESLLGNWTITGKFSNNNDVFTELQQTFRIIKEDPENPIEEHRTISYLTAQSVDTTMGQRHRFVISSHEFIEGESCHIMTPDGKLYTLTNGHSSLIRLYIADIDLIEEDGVECGVMATVTSEDMAGEWTLIARAKQHLESIERRLPFTINVEVNSENATTPDDSATMLTLVRDRVAKQFVGPTDAVYCRLEDPQGLTVFDSFGRCYLELDKVGLEHNGIWKILVAGPSTILTREQHLVVNVIESEGKPVVATKVIQAKPIVTIVCTVQPNAEVTGCKFRNPQGNILVANSGLSEDRYSFYGKGASNELGVLSHECGIRITNPLTSDLGLWRCALESTEETYYGHLPVLCPWALSKPEVAATVQQEPILKPTRSLVNAVEEEPVVMSCSVEAVIRYCYFRFSNGTTFTVNPGMSSSSMEYVGASFDAGECGIRFYGLQAADSGRWSCHVGLVGDNLEQRTQFQVTVHERMRVSHYQGDGNIATVEGIVHEGRALEYCRFVRIDGFGFTSDAVPADYTLIGNLSNGECRFTIHHPTMLDLHPWTIAAKIRGQDVEIAKDTFNSVIIGGPPLIPENQPDQIVHSNGLAIFLYIFLSLLLLSIILGGLLGTQKNRKMTAAKVSVLHKSISNSFRKEKTKQPQDIPAPNYTP